MTTQIIAKVPLGLHWPTLDPFLFCAHHDDRYPAGDGALAPAESVEDRPLGSDFSGRDGWSMYHGRRVPGFPAHPHRGFETVSIARRGFIDHADSMGAHARFGEGDVQWMTAGNGVVHSEMFPLRNTDAPNRTELFQIWLNLPAASRRADAYFTMFWSEDVPALEAEGARVSLIAGSIGGLTAPAPPPSSWASDPRGDVVILTIRLEPGASWTLPAAKSNATRTLYFFDGDRVEMAGESIGPRTGVQLDAGATVPISNSGTSVAELLLLQGNPIGEPVVHHGPFVMSSQGEIHETIREYQRTQFGGWPWPTVDPVHGNRGRFAVHADGRSEEPGG